MSFEKSRQRTTTPEYVKYVEALMRYKKATKEHCLFLKSFKHLKDSDNPLDRLRFLEEKEAHSQRCKDYHNARETYTDAIARSVCKAKGIDLSVVDIAKIAGENTPISMAEIIKAERAAAIEKTVSPEDYEIVRAAMEARAQRKIEAREADAEISRNVRKSFLASKEDKDDPTFGDFDPL